MCRVRGKPTNRKHAKLDQQPGALVTCWRMTSAPDPLWIYGYRAMNGVSHKVRAATDVVVLQAFFNSREPTTVLYESVLNRGVAVVMPSTGSFEAYIANNDRKITLSGLLKFIDGLWSSYGDERIIVFITNHKDSLDEALLRPGRIDVHLEMSYCTYGVFKVLASTYLQVKEEEKLEVFHVVKYLLEKVKATLAEIANQCNQILFTS
ncbi:hyper-sensitivity-related 4-like protein [Tanacetum coccineum]|uniref:Hyper-sensitivity-related 4-like protein n=1 Tax=Tanacetum coccineum TaxID=301880 RepID=A0ABQ4ZAF6_9ASTR